MVVVVEIYGNASVCLTTTRPHGDIMSLRHLDLPPMREERTEKYVKNAVFFSFFSFCFFRFRSRVTPCRRGHRSSKRKEKKIGEALSVSSSFPSTLLLLLLRRRLFSSSFLVLFVPLGPAAFEQFTIRDSYLSAVDPQTHADGRKPMEEKPKI